MKSIELTKEHQTKLLEMCKVLFNNMFALTIQENGFLNYSESKKSLDYDDHIHWFEFCTTHLAYKILNKDKYKVLFLYITFGIKINKSELYHPIDYLYSEFKKLK